MASLLENMLQPASTIRAQAPQTTPQAPSTPQPQDSNDAQKIIQGVQTAAQVAAMFL